MDGLANLMEIFLEQGIVTDRETGDVKSTKFIIFFVDMNLLENSKRKFKLIGTTLSKWGL